MLTQDILSETFNPELEEAVSRRGFLGGAVGAAVTAAGIGQAKAAPFQRNSSGQMLTQVRINGEGPFRFILDTGANVTCVSQRIVNQLDLEPISSGETVVGNEGRSQARRVLLPNVEVAGVQRDQINALVMASNQFDAGTHGILGADSFSGQRVVFDIQQNEYHVGPSGDPSENFVIVQGELRRRHILFVNVEINGHRVPAMVDTGAEMTFVNPSLMQLAGLPRIREITTRAQMQGDRNAIREVGTAIESINFGPVQTERVEAHGTIIPVFRNREGQETPGLLIGMNVWRGYSQIAIDYERSQLQIAR